MRTGFFMPVVMVITLAFASGCGSTASTPEKSLGKASEKAAVTTDATNDAVPNDGWWCVEHGMPEEICAQCSSKIAAEFKKKGDWCKEHDRPDSQCFICQPELESKFASQYEAKYGKKPPKPEG